MENTIKRDELYKLVMEYMKLLNNAEDGLFKSKQDRLLKYILKIVQDDKRLFDIESALSQKCSQKLLENNSGIKTSLQTLTSGDIKNINDSFQKSEKIFQENDISKDDYSDKVKLTKLIDIADNKNNLTYNEISNIMKVDQDEVETLVIKAIECDFAQAVLDQPNEKVYFNKVLRRNVGSTNLKDIDQGLENLLTTLNQFTF